MAELWGLLKPIRGADKTWNSAEVWLVGKDVIADTETIKPMKLERLQEVLAKAKEEIANMEAAPV